MSRLAVYVPTDEQLQEKIADGSGIVGSEVSEIGRLRLDFEGNQELYDSYEARVQRAAERHLWDGPDGQRGYPTSAMAYADPDAVAQVGWWTPDTKSLEVTDPSTLTAWLGKDVP